MIAHEAWHRKLRKRYYPSISRLPSVISAAKLVSAVRLIIFLSTQIISIQLYMKLGRKIYKLGSSPQSHEVREFILQSQNMIYNISAGFYKGSFRINTLRPRQNGRHFAYDIFNCILLNENVWVMIENPLKFVPTGPINNIPALVQIMAWCRPGDKPLSEPMLVSLPTHICVTRPQWVNHDFWRGWQAMYVIFGRMFPVWQHR